MSIIRSHRKRHNFSILDNSGAIDTRLSYRARGILWYALTKPDNWEISINDLIKQSPKEGRDSIKTTLAEMEQCGYAVRWCQQDEKGLFEWKTEIFETTEDCTEWKTENHELLKAAVRTKWRSGSTDEPSTDEPSTDEPSTDEPSTDEPSTDEPSTDEPSTDEPSTDEPSTANPHLVITNRSITDLVITDLETTEKEITLAANESENRSQNQSEIANQDQQNTPEEFHGSEFGNQPEPEQTEASTTRSDQLNDRGDAADHSGDKPSARFSSTANYEAGWNNGRHLYPELVKVGFGDVWVGPGFTDFAPEVVRAACAHLRKHDRPSEPADGRNYLKNCIYKQDWAAIEERRREAQTSKSTPEAATQKNYQAIIDADRAAQRTALLAKVGKSSKKSTLEGEPEDF